jgi:hypothetical protein
MINTGRRPAYLRDDLLIPFYIILILFYHHRGADVTELIYFKQHFSVPCVSAVNTLLFIS